KLIYLFNSARVEVGRGAHFAEDAVGADYRVLDVRPRLALKAERLLEVESNDRSACKLEQEVTKRGDRDLVSDAPLPRLMEIGVSRADFLEGVRFEPVDQIVGLHTEALAS